MIINHDKMDEFIKTLKAHKCPLCGNGEWTVSDTVFYVQEFKESEGKGVVTLTGSSRFMPFITISCSQCGNTHIINTLVNNLYENRENEPNDSEVNR